jgi:insertion element IS1 protein InsB
MGLSCLPHIAKGTVIPTFGMLDLAVIPKKQHGAVDKETGETAHIERFNNMIRQRLGRFVRKTLSFSK